MKSRRLRWIVLVVCLFFVQTMQAQQNFRISGVVLNDAEEEALIQASVSLQQITDSARSYLAVSNDSGLYQFNGVAAGEYRLKVAYMGYEDFEATLSIDKDSVLPSIYLRDNAKLLDEVKVVANYTKTDVSGNKSVLVQGNPMAEGKDMGLFLRSFSDLRIWGDNLSIHGNPGTLIFINDRQSSFEDLKAIPTSMISRIEIKPVADAKYKAGAGGVLLVYLKEQGGLLGSATINSWFDKHGIVVNMGNLMTIYTKGQFSIDNTLKVTLDGRQTSKNERQYNTSDKTTITNTENVRRAKRVMDNMGVRYYYNKNNKQEHFDIYGGLGLFWRDNNQWNTIGETLTHIMEGGRDADYSIGMQLWKSLSKKHDDWYIDMKSSYSGASTKQNVDYLAANETNRIRQITNDFYINTNFHFGDNGHAWDLVLSYSNSEDRDDATGIFSSRYNLPETRFTDKDRSFSALASYRTTFLKKGYAVFDLHAIQRNRDYIDRMNNNEVTKMDESGIYPSTSLTWTFNQQKNQRISLYYTHSFSYPNFYYYTALKQYYAENLYSIGNKHLRKERMDYLTVYFSLNNRWSFNYSLNHRGRTVNVLTFEDADEDGVYYTMPVNCGNMNTHRFSVAYSGSLFKFWYNNTSWEYAYHHETMPGKKVASPQFSFSTYNQFTLNNYLKLWLSIYYATKTKRLTYDARQLLTLSCGATAIIIKNKLNVNLRLQNLYRIRPIYTTYGDGWTIKQIDYTDMPRLSISATWNFTAGKKIEKRSTNAVGVSTRQDPR